MIAAVLAALAVGTAAFRVAMLAAHDTIVDPVRHPLQLRCNPDVRQTLRRRAGCWVAQLIDCPYCASVWAAGILGGLVAAFGAPTVDVPWPIDLVWIVAACGVAEVLVSKVQRP